MPTTGAPSLVRPWPVEEVREVHEGGHDAAPKAHETEGEDDGGEEQEPREQVPCVGAGQDAAEDAEADAEREASPGDPGAAAHGRRPTSPVLRES